MKTACIYLLFTIAALTAGLLLTDGLSLAMTVVVTFFLVLTALPFAALVAYLLGGWSGRCKPYYERDNESILEPLLSASYLQDKVLPPYHSADHEPPDDRQFEPDRLP